MPAAWAKNTGGIGELVEPKGAGLSQAQTTGGMRLSQLPDVPEASTPLRKDAHSITQRFYGMAAYRGHSRAASLTTTHCTGTARADEAARTSQEALWKPYLLRQSQKAS
ncbi:hypothetical protein HaloA020_28930 [Halomonas sp. A020]|nr:hypothetical protein HaloA020_28930 [Halomonas sp. A020]